MKSDFTAEERKEFDTYADAYNKFVEELDGKRIQMLNKLLELYRKTC